MATGKKFNELMKYLIGLTGYKNAVRLRYFHGFKKFPNLKHPVTFNEKINSYKFMCDRYQFHLYADKVTVKDFVAKKIGIEHVIPTFFAGKTLPPPHERTWPLPYIIKMNNSSGWNIMVRNEAERNWPEIEKKIAKWSKMTFGRDTGEVHYSKISPQILIEPFLSTQDGKSPPDFKFHMIHGEVAFTEVDVDREIIPGIYCYYDGSWTKLPLAIEEFSIKTPYFSEIDVPKPEKYEQMVSFAKTLSHDFPLVRVDFYNHNNQIYFGEMTFTPFAGFCKFYPEKYDYYYGEQLKLT